MEQQQAARLLDTFLQLNASSLSEREALSKSDYDKWFKDAKKIQGDFRTAFEQATGFKIVHNYPEDETFPERWVVSQ